MSLRLTNVCLHQPMIRFKYALAKGGAAGSAAATVKAGSTAPAQQQQQPIYETFDQLPANLRPKLMTDVEIETVLMGGAAPYVPKHLQKKKK